MGKKGSSDPANVEPAPEATCFMIEVLFMVRRSMVRMLLAGSAVAVMCSWFVVGCGGDDPAGEACEDPNRNVAAGSLNFNDECCADAECSAETGKCATFNNKGQHCTKPCTSDADCTGLGDGKCGGQMVCAVPG